MSGAFVVVKFAPSRCPACERRFDSPATFGRWGGNQGALFVEAQAAQMHLYPELFPPIDEPGVEHAWANRHRADFIICYGCGNKTLRIGLDERTVATRAEAERLAAAGGYTCIVETEILGTSVED